MDVPGGVSCHHVSLAVLFSTELVCSGRSRSGDSGEALFLCPLTHFSKDLHPPLDLSFSTERCGSPELRYHRAQRLGKGSVTQVQVPELGGMRAAVIGWQPKTSALSPWSSTPVSHWVALRARAYVSVFKTAP